MMINAFLVYVAAAISEIAGCYFVWSWLRLKQSPLWLIPALFCLFLFAYLLTRIDSNTAGRAYAAYGGIYILMSIIWLWLIEATPPDRWDVTGVTLCLVGAAVILLGPR